MADAATRGRRPRRESFAERRERHAAIDDPEIVLNAAARFLETRSRSVAEVRRRLTTAGYRPDLVEDAIARLLELHMLDDEAFARGWVESRDRGRPRGAIALRRELALKGIDRDTAEIVLAERDEAAAEPADAAGDAVADDTASADELAARRLLTRRAGSLARIADPRLRRQRMYALLARNGFDPAVCSEVSARFAETAPEDGVSEE